MNRFWSSSARSLGITRSFVHCVFLLCILATSFSALGQLPITILRPTGLMKLVPWSFYDWALTHVYVFKAIMVVSLLMGTFGILSSLTTKTSLVLVLFYEGLVRSFGHFNHDEMAAIYCLCVLAFVPCGDDFSMDHWLRRKRPEQPLFAYGFPIFLMQVILAWSYFSSALVKLRVAGLSYFSVDNLPVLAIVHSLDNLHDTSFRLAFWLPQIRTVLPIVIGLVLIWELLFPLAIFSRRARWLVLGFGVLFHVSTVFLMNLFFPFQLAMYLVFVDWDKVASRLNRESVLDSK